MTNIAGRLKRGEKITGYLNQIFTCCLFCGKRKKLQDSQTRHVSAYVPDMVWKKWNRRAENGIKCCFIFSREVKKLNYRVLKNTDRTQSLWWFRRQWHDTQTSYWQRAVWKRIKLQGSQTPPWCSSRFRREIHGSQTYTQAKDIDRLTWKKIELQDSQTIHFNPRLV